MNFKPFGRYVHTGIEILKILSFNQSGNRKLINRNLFVDNEEKFAANSIFGIFGNF